VPGFQLVQGFTEARLARGIDAREAAAVRAFVLDGRATPNDIQQERLLRLSALYADYFTPSAKAAWQKLTGIDVDQAEVTCKKSARLYRNVLDARIDLAAEKKHIQTEHVVTSTARGVDVRSRFLVPNVAARKAMASHGRMDHDDVCLLPRTRSGFAMRHLIRSGAPRSDRGARPSPRGRDRRRRRWTPRTRTPGRRPTRARRAAGSRAPRE
jgi:hypothetical protein